MSIAVYASLLDATERADNARNFRQYGGNPELVKLRCFKYYHPDQGSFLTSPDGVERWVGPKASRVWAIASRGDAVTTTMKAIAAEAMCCVSTVSRALTRLQAFGFLAVDVRRGRNGGITIRLRRVGDAMKHYVAAAWKRIRSWIKVASRSFEGELSTTSTPLPKDATFSEGTEDPLQAVRHLHPNDPFRRAVVKQLTEARRIEHAGAMVSQGEWSIDYAQAWYDAKN